MQPCRWPSGTGPLPAATRHLLLVLLLVLLLRMLMLVLLVQ